MSYETPEVTAHNLKTIRGWNMKRVMREANPTVSVDAAVAELPGAVTFPEERMTETQASGEISDAA
jgi:hypothetical protein